MRIELRSGRINGQNIHVLDIDKALAVASFTRKGDAKRVALAYAAEAKRKGYSVTLIGMVG